MRCCWWSSRARTAGALLSQLARLGELMADLGFPGAVVEAVEPDFQRAVWDVRKSGLNIMMSMKGDGKPVSFVEDCAVRLEDLAEYNPSPRRDLHAPRDSRHLVRARVGRHPARASDHRPEGRGRCAPQCGPSPRNASRWCASTRAPTPGSTATESCGASFTKRCSVLASSPRSRRSRDAFDPDGLFNPGKIVRPERMDDRELFRYKPGYASLPVETGLDWSEWDGFHRARSRVCNNNGTCRKSNPGVMCPSYRVTMDEKHVTRGRANTLRLALTGQLGPDALTSDAMAETMALCVGMQGLQARVPHRRRHGADEDRVPPSAPEAARAGPARPRRRVAAPLCSDCEPARMDDEPARPAPGARRRHGASRRFERTAHPPPLADRPVPRR